MDDTSDPFAEAPAPPPPKKKSLFNKPVPKPATKPTNEEEAVDFFSRSREVFPKHLLEQQRRRDKKVARLERKRSSTSVEKKENSPPGEKRRRISSRSAYSSDEEGGRKRNEPTQSTSPSCDTHKSPKKECQPSLYTLSGRYSRDLQTKKDEKPPTDSGIITLTDSEDEGDVQSYPVRRAPAGIPLTDDENTYKAPREPIALSDDDEGGQSDDEYAEYLQQARERQRQKMAQAQSTAMKFEQQNQASKSVITSDDDMFSMGEPQRDADPVLEILVTSQIEGTKPLIVKRRFKSRLLEVRKSWCDKQRLEDQPMFPSPEAQDGVFLTYKGKRLYDLTACASLGLKIDADGRVINDFESDTNGRVHLFAWTDNLFDEHQRIEERKAQGIEEEDYLQEKIEEERLRVTLKSKDNGEHKLKARAAITFEKIASAFRREKGIPDTQEVLLKYDGDTLDPEQTIGDSEIEDMDVIEVHIR